MSPKTSWRSTWATGPASPPRRGRPLGWSRAAGDTVQFISRRRRLGVGWCGVPGSMVWCGVSVVGDCMVWYSIVCYIMLWYSMLWYGNIWYGMLWYGMAWYGMVWCGMVWYGVVRYGLVWSGIVWYYILVVCYLVQYMVCYVMACRVYGMLCDGMSGYGMVWYGMVYPLYGLIRYCHSTGWFGVVGRSLWYCMVRFCVM